MAEKVKGVSAAVMKRAAKIKLLLMDVDGTLTDGRVTLASSMSTGDLWEIKSFDSQDGAGLTLAHIMGLKTGLITGRKSAATAQRAKENKIDYVYQGRAKKLAAYEECQQLAGVDDSATAYMGDDLPDLPLLNRAGLAVAPSTAVREVKDAAHYITHAAAGRGAAREVVELILRAQGRWKEAIPKALA